MKLDWEKLDIFSGKTVVQTIDAHTAGEPLRIYTTGLPELDGETILERRRDMRERLDHFRTALMYEPRGHFDMYGCVVTPPVTPTANIGVLFLHNEGYSTMCGHGIIAVVTALIETGAMSPSGVETPINIDTPAGLVRATAHIGASGNVTYVSFLNVDSFVYRQDMTVDVPEFGEVLLDISFGGAFYAILPAERVHQQVTIENRQPLVDLATRIKAAVNKSVSINHPLEEDLGFLYGVIFTDEPESPAHHSRNLCVFANAEVDRSPTGTGVSSRLALHYAKGEIEKGQKIVIESVLGARSTMTGCVVEEAQVGEHAAVTPQISGKAYLTGRHSFVIDPRDPLQHGFLL